MSKKNSRHTFVILVALVLIGVAVWMVVMNRNESATESNVNQSPVQPATNVETTANSNTKTNTTAQSKDITFELPGYTAADTITGANELTYRYSAQNSITVLPAEQVAAVRESLGQVTEQPATVDGVDATQLTGRSQKDGSETVVLIVDLGASNMIVRGDGAFLEAVQADLDIQETE